MKSCFSMSISLPNTLEKIAMDTFWNTSITEIFIPKSVRTIDQFGFSEAIKLQSIIFEEGISATINFRPFENCRSLKLLILPSNIRLRNYQDFYRTFLSDVYICSPTFVPVGYLNFQNTVNIPTFHVTRYYKGETFMGKNVTIMNDKDYCYTEMNIKSCVYHNYNSLSSISFSYILVFATM